MPLQNRVTPFGDIVAIPQRGLFTGNRGILHDPATRTLTARRWASKAWLICICDYKGRRRQVMGGRTWTELFFLDEAVALAAGHRPCFLCRRDAAEHFRQAWAIGAGISPPSASAIDVVLHRQRRVTGDSTPAPLPAPVSRLPDGAVIQASGAAFTMVGGRAYRWTSDGYASGQSLSSADGLLTPRSTLAALEAGYRPSLHPALGPMNGVGHA